jgi:hypothetical protein
MDNFILIDKNTAYYNNEKLKPHIVDAGDPDTWISRFVFFGSNIVVKADNGEFLKNRNKKTHNQCETEISITKKIVKKPYHKLFVPIINYGKIKFEDRKWTYTVSPLLEWSSEEPSLHKDIRLLLEAIDELQLLDICPYTKRNCAVSKSGRLFVYDYGLTA